MVACARSAARACRGRAPRPGGSSAGIQRLALRGHRGQGRAARGGQRCPGGGRSEDRGAERTGRGDGAVPGQGLLQQRTSGGCWRTLEGLADFAIVQSYLSTAAKWGISNLDALRQLFTNGPWLPPVTAPP